MQSRGTVLRWLAGSCALCSFNNIMYTNGVNTFFRHRIYHRCGIYLQFNVTDLLARILFIHYRMKRARYPRLLPLCDRKPLGSWGWWWTVSSHICRSPNSRPLYYIIRTFSSHIHMYTIYTQSYIYI